MGVLLEFFSVESHGTLTKSLHGLWLCYGGQNTPRLPVTSSRRAALGNIPSDIMSLCCITQHMPQCGLDTSTMWVPTQQHAKEGRPGILSCAS